MSEHDTHSLYRVLVNLEEQYSIWPAFKEIPAGWEPIGEAAPKDVCLDYIAQHWTDMRPKSLRDAMAGPSEGAVAASTSSSSAGPR
jgi:MbtH protein